VIGQTQTSTSPTFRVEVNYVEEAVRVVDPAGNFIRGLTQEDFQLSEDGKPQRIVSFVPIDIPFVRRETSTYAGPAGQSVEPDVASNAQDVDVRLYVVLMDDYHISPARTGQAKQLARRFVLEHLGANDYATVVAASGDLNATQDFTQNRQLLLAAIDRFTGRKLPPATLALIDARQQQQEGKSTAAQEDPDEAERVANARSTMRTLTSLAVWLTPIRGRRKAIVYVSEGVDNYNYFDVFGSRDYPIGDSRNANARERNFDAVRRAAWDAAEAAARANVQVYSVDPRGLTSGSDDALIGAVPTGAFAAGPASLASELKTSQDYLRQLAEQTGGVAALNTNDFKQAFDVIVRENSSYYVLGYYSSNEKRDGRMRAVSLRIPARPDLQLSYRTRYAGPSGKELAQATEMTASPIPLRGLSLRVSAVPHKGSGKTAALDVLIEASGRDLTFKETDGIFNDTISISMRTFDRQGKAAAGERFDLNLKLKPETLHRVLEHGVRVVRTMSILPGQYGLRITAQDSAGGKRGSVRFDVEVPDFANEPLGMSGIFLASTGSPAFTSWNRTFGELLPGSPTTVREFRPGDELTAFVEIYDNQPQPAHRLNITATVQAPDGKAVFAHRDERSTEELHGAAGGFGYVSRIPVTAWNPGFYVLTIEATSTLGDREAVRRTIPFRVISTRETPQ
jgi:VWFA-related protein